MYTVFIITPNSDAVERSAASELGVQCFQNIPKGVFDYPVEKD